MLIICYKKKFQNYIQLLKFQNYIEVLKEYIHSIIYSFVKEPKKKKKMIKKTKNKDIGMPNKYLLTKWSLTIIQL